MPGLVHGAARVYRDPHPPFGHLLPRGEGGDGGIYAAIALWESAASSRAAFSWGWGQSRIVAAPCRRAIPCQDGAAILAHLLIGPPPSLANGANFSRIKCWSKIGVALIRPSGTGIHAAFSQGEKAARAAYMPPSPFGRGSGSVGAGGEGGEENLLAVTIKC